jgi:hypothetical protein
LLLLFAGTAPAAGGSAAAASSRPATAPPVNTSLPGDANDPNQYPFWNVRRYRPLFNVDTKVGGAAAAGEAIEAEARSGAAAVDSQATAV